MWEGVAVGILVVVSNVVSFYLGARAQRSVPFVVRNTHQGRTTSVEYVNPTATADPQGANSSWGMLQPFDRLAKVGSEHPGGPPTNLRRPPSAVAPRRRNGR